MRIAPDLRYSLDRNPKQGYLPALDGLRALAVIAVMLFHLDRQFLPGGRYGVDLFFVLSGFLITTLLLQEWVGTGSISLSAFYKRRILRLMPAALFFIFIYLVSNAVLSDQTFNEGYPFRSSLRNATLAVIYIFNWLPALGGEAGRAFLHIWSLSVEEQFYLLWPAALLLMLKVRMPAVAILGVTLAVLVTSAFIPAFIGGDWDRFYYGTDFRIQGPLAGCLLAQLYVGGIVGPQTVLRKWFNCLIALILIAFLASLLLIEDTSYFLFNGGHTIFAAGAALLVLACVFRERSPLAFVLSHPILTYIGRRSYALYLWHVLWVGLSRPYDPFTALILVAVLSFASAELSYRFVESPALRLKSRLGKPQSSPAPSSAALQQESNPNAAA